MIDKRATSLIEAMLQLNLDGEAKVDYLDCLKVGDIVDYYVARLEVSMDKILIVDVLNTHEDAFDDLGALLICELLALRCISREQRLSRGIGVVIVLWGSSNAALNEVCQGTATSVLDCKDDVVREFSNLKLRNDRLTCLYWITFEW